MSADYKEVKEKFALSPTLGIQRQRYAPTGENIYVVYQKKFLGSKLCRTLDEAQRMLINPPAFKKEYHRLNVKKDISLQYITETGRPVWGRVE